MDSAAVLETAEWMARARALLAYGGFDGVVQRPLCYDEHGVFPQFASRAQGCELFDTTGQSFVDWVNGWGPVILGYRHPEVEEAIKGQLEAGPTLSLMHPVEIEVAERIARLVPCAEMVAFGKNGSDVVTAAVRVARAVTGRQLVLQYGMHGFHDWAMCMFPGVRGLPEVLRPLLRSFPYNDLAALEDLFARNAGQVAALVMEPVREILPEPGYLSAVQELCRRHGALFILDEIVTAFRIADGGAQELFGVVPDLACLGKAMGNGMPLAALVGKRVHMQHLPSVGFGMTFRGETLSLAAARACLDVIVRERVTERLARIGERVRAGFAALAARHAVPTKLTGPPARMTFIFQDEAGVSHDQQRELFLQECLKHGVFTNGNLLASFAIDDAAIARTLAGFDKALAQVALALREGRSGADLPAGGASHGPRALAATGFVEAFVEATDSLHVAGWLLLPDGAPDTLVARGAGGVEIECAVVARPDLAQAFAHLPRAGDAGWAITLPAASFADARQWDLSLCAKRGPRIGFLCRIVRRRGVELPAGPYSLGDGALYL